MDKVIKDYSEIDRLAKIIWDYHQLHHKLKKSDCLFVLGSHDLRVAEYAARLFLQGWAPIMVCSGSGFGHKKAKDLLGTPWIKPESELFADKAISMGVPKEKIIIESQSMNTGENVKNTKQLLAKNGLDFKTFILVQKPYMERRGYATFKKIWPEKEVIVTSPPISYEQYPNDEIAKDTIINIMVGDLQRIKEYPQLGFQIYQEIPKKIWTAYTKLVELGYTKHLII